LPLSSDAIAEKERHVSSSRKNTLLTEISNSDAALLHGAIMMAANHIVMLGGEWKEVSPAFYYHKGEIIRLVNHRLTSGIARADVVSDETIAAVAILVVVEVNIVPARIFYH
jgi:hypothetical protein